MQTPNAWWENYTWGIYKVKHIITSFSFAYYYHHFFALVLTDRSVENHQSATNKKNLRSLKTRSRQKAITTTSSALVLTDRTNKWKRQKQSNSQINQKPPKRHQQEELEEPEDDEDAVETDGHNNNIVYKGDSKDPNPHLQLSRLDPNPGESERCQFLPVNIDVPTAKIK
ncbi:hypothetical protein OIU84_020599 [Salix udensis]|uniref:Uncharacterized protein n=1 Tax=Salix udensis TaxID=889485 RepID=A0AAD6KUR7_9ROSI|nr:hypothetical protein OIU84_020599 [Salix udensis]